jgi:hypothetical protein
MADDTTPRTGSPSPKLSEQEFKRRFLDQYRDSAFCVLNNELQRVAAVAWDGYSSGLRAPKRARRVLATLTPTTIWRPTGFMPLKRSRSRSASTKRAPTRIIIFSLMPPATVSIRARESSPSLIDCWNWRAKCSKTIQRALCICWIWVDWPPNLVGRSIRARPVSPRRPLCVTGLARVTRITHWGRHRIG